MQATRARIIEAAAALFMERGLTASGLKQISQASGAPVGSLYHFFPGGKGELAAETLRHAGRAYAAVVTELLLSEPDPVDALQACFAGAAETLEESGYADACPIATVALEVSSCDDALRRVTDEIFAGWLDGLRAWLMLGGVPEVDAARLAPTILAALEGGFLLCRAARDTAAMRAIGASMARLVAQCVPQDAPIGATDAE